MENILDANQETACLDFKRTFEPASLGDWLELGESMKFTKICCCVTPRTTLLRDIAMLLLTRLSKRLNVIHFFEKCHKEYDRLKATAAAEKQPQAFAV